MKQLGLLVVWLMLAQPALAVIETYEFSDPALEVRYQYLSEELRCPKCQNQNIADSNAPISQDLRRLLYEQLEEGASDEEIRNYMVARYGEFVRYRPAFNAATAVLWLAPVGLLLIGLVVGVMTLRGRRTDTSAGLDASEQQKLNELIRQAEREE